MAEAAPAAPAPTPEAAPAPAEGKEAPEKEAKDKPEPKEPDDKAKPKPPEKKKWSFKDDDDESPEEYDDPEEMAKAYREKRALAKRGQATEALVQTAYKKAQEAEAREKRLKDDPDSALAELGLDPLALAYKRINAHLAEEAKYEGKSEQEIAALKKAEANERKIAEYEAKEAESKKATEAEAYEKMKQSHREATVKTINAALAETSLPPTAEVQARMAHLLKLNAKMGLGLAPVLLARKVEAEVRAELAAMDRDEDFDAKAYLSKHPKRAEAIRKAHLEALKLAKETPAVPPAGGGPADKGEAKPRTYEEYQEHIRKQRRG